MIDTMSHEYKTFIIKNRLRINYYLNYALWSFILAGPAIALGVKAEVFPNISYVTCISISSVISVLASFHLVLVKRVQNTLYASAFALMALNFLLVYMALNNVSIYLTWFLVPLLSILFCEKRLFFYALTMNYILMVITSWAMSPGKVVLRNNYENAFAYFVDTIGGFTIETIVMAVSGYMIIKLNIDYFKGLCRQYEVIQENKKREQRKMDTLVSMSQIYDNVNLINFADYTELPISDTEPQRYKIDAVLQTQTLMNQKLLQQLMPDQINDFCAFTNIQTLRSRMKNKKVISADFLAMKTGWFRAQYITVEKDASGIPTRVIYTTRNVEDEKRREAYLRRLSMTDEMTRLFNRRSYLEDLEVQKENILKDDLVIFSVDVNGLKILNDTKGHLAGNELIKGAADCLVYSVGQLGKVYRVGGDEFMAIVHTDYPEKICEVIEQKTREWRGMYSDSLAVSVGYAAHRDYPEVPVAELERLADANMYAAKEKYYQETGMKRR